MEQNRSKIADINKRLIIFAILSVVSGIIGVLLASVISINFLSPDFDVDNPNINSNSLYLNSSNMFDIFVDSYKLKNYNYPVFLHVEETPPGIDVKIIPNMGLPEFKSCMIINITSHAKVGKKNITISSIGGDGKVKYYKYAVNILDKPGKNAPKLIRIKINTTKNDKIRLITFRADAVDLENRPLVYRYLLKCPSNQTNWIETTNWTDSNSFAFCSNDFSNDLRDIKIRAEVMDDTNLIDSREVMLMLNSSTS